MTKSERLLLEETIADEISAMAEMHEERERLMEKIAERSQRVAEMQHKLKFAEVCENIASPIDLTRYKVEG